MLGRRSGHDPVGLHRRQRRAHLIATTTLGAEVRHFCLWIILISCAIKPSIQSGAPRVSTPSLPAKPASAGFNEVPGPRLLQRQLDRLDVVLHGADDPVCRSVPCSAASPRYSTSSCPRYPPTRGSPCSPSSPCSCCSAAAMGRQSKAGHLRSGALHHPHLPLRHGPDAEGRPVRNGVTSPAALPSACPPRPRQRRRRLRHHRRRRSPEAVRVPLLVRRERLRPLHSARDGTASWRDRALR